MAMRRSGVLHRIESFPESFDWAVPDGHCEYLDTLLDLGVIGAALCAATLFTGIRERAAPLPGGRRLRLRILVHSVRLPGF